MKKITTVLVIVVSLLLLATSTVWAFGEIRYPDRPLNLRKGRSAKTPWVGSLYPGQKVRISFLENGWVAVFEPGETRNSEAAAVGYSNIKYLLPKQTRVEPKSWGELVYTGRTLNVRSKPSVDGKKIDTLKAMEHVKIDFPEDDWTMIFSPDATIRSEMNAIGYCSSKYFKPATQSTMAQAGLGKKPKVSEEKVPVPSAVSEAVEVASGHGQTGGSVASAPAPATTTTGSWGDVVTVKDKINVRQARTSSSRYVRTLEPGERIRVDFLKNGWYAVFEEHEGVRNESRALGYVLQSLLEGDETGAVSETPQKSIAKVMPQADAVPTAIEKQVSTSVPPKADVQKTMVIDRSRFSNTKRVDPTPDKTAHGYQYRIIEKAETKRLGETWITVKVFLATKKLPGTDALRDFSATLWRENKRTGKNVAILVYLPGMDMEDLSFGVTKFDDEQMLEFWVRKATLFGTEYM